MKRSVKRIICTLLVIVIQMSFIPTFSVPAQAAALSYAEGGQSVEDPGVDIDVSLRRYVDAAGGSDGNDGKSPGSAWKTLAKVASESSGFVSGMHILLKRGEKWNEHVDISNIHGIDGNRIVFGAYGPVANGRPVIDAISNNNTNPNGTGSIYYSGCSHITVRDLEMEQVAFKFGSHDILIYNNEVHQMSSAILNSGIIILSGSYNTAIVENLVYDITNNDSISIHDVDWLNPPQAVGKSHWVIDNIIIGTYSQEDAIDVASLPYSETNPPQSPASDIKIINNRISMAPVEGISNVTPPEGYAGENKGQYGITVAHSAFQYWIMGNTVTQAGTCGIQAISTDAGARNHDAQISGNVVYECGDGTKAMPSMRIGMENALIQNNTVIHTLTSRDVLLLPDAVSTAAQNIAKDNRIRRNLFMSNSPNFVTGGNDPYAFKVKEMNHNWYGNAAEPKVFAQDWATWKNNAMGFDSKSLAGVVYGVSIPPATIEDRNPQNWNNSGFWDYFIPDINWAGYNISGYMAGAFDFNGRRLGMNFYSFASLNDNNGYGWAGPEIIRERYPLPSQRNDPADDPLEVPPALIMQGDKLWVEAEYGKLTSPMQIYEDAAASNGKYITVPGGYPTNDAPFPYPGNAEFEATFIQSGQYYIWARVYANGSSRAVYFSVDGGSKLWQAVPSSSAGGSYEWIKIWPGIPNTGYFALGSGVHTFTLTYRKPTFRIDKLLITTDKAYVPSNDVISPNAPSNLSAGNITASGAALSWEAPLNDTSVKGYEVYQNGVMAYYTQETSMAVSGLKDGAVYTYKVRVVDVGDNYSPFSNEISIKTIDVTPPSVPENFKVKYFTDTVAKLEWNASTDNDKVSYYVIYTVDENGYAKKIGSSSTTYLRLAKLTPGETYTFRIVAVDPSYNRSGSADTVVTLPPDSSNITGVYDYTGGILVFEAENGFITAPMAVYEDENASGGKFVTAKTGKPNSPVRSVPGEVDYEINFAEAGTYHVWLRVFFADGVSDSLWVSFDDNPTTRFVGEKPYGAWTWRRVFDVNGVNLPAGVHSLNLMHRDINSKADRIVISNDANYIPDEEAPVITVEGVAEGQAYNDSVTPLVRAEDLKSGLKSLKVTVDGQDWTQGTAVEGKGPHTLAAVAEDNFGNIAAITVNFTVYCSTSLDVESASGVYSDTTMLRVLLADKEGRPLPGATVAFRLDGTAVGTAVTDAGGTAVLAYKVAVGASTDAETLDYVLQAVYAQDDAAYYRGSTGSGVLTVAKEEVLILYTGTMLSRADAYTTLSARVEQQADGEPGEVSGLPVQFTLSRVNPDGSTAPYAYSVTEAVYSTDAEGAVTAVVRLPAGLYEVRACLLPNAYYKAAEAKTIAAVYDPAVGKTQAEGWYALPDGGDVFIGTSAKKMHFETEWEYEDDTGLPEGKLKLHAEPKGLKLEMERADWVVATGDSAYMQGEAFDGQGQAYTVRLMLGNRPVSDAGESGKEKERNEEKKGAIVSLIIWSGRDTAQQPVYQAYGQEMKGEVKIGHKEKDDTKD